MKSLFLSRPIREKILFLLLVITGLAIWTNSLRGRISEWRQTDARTENETLVQKTWIAQAPLIEARQQKAIANLDPSRTYDGVRLQAEVSTMAKNAGLANATVTPSKTTGNRQLSLHTVTVQLRNIGMDGLVALYRDISNHNPYICIERIRIEAARNAPKLLTVSLDLSAVQAQPQQ